MSEDFEWTIFDEGEADTIHSALTAYAAEQWKLANRFVDIPSLAENYRYLARKADALIGRLDDALYPVAEPPDEYEPPLPKDEGRDFDGRDYGPLELQQIRSQSGTLA